MFRNVVIVFHQQDIYREELYQRTLQIHRSHSDFENDGHNLPHFLSGLRRTSSMHTHGNLIMSESWERQFELAHGMVNLASITFDLSKFFCPTGCCRKETMLSMFNHFLYEFDTQAAIKSDLKYRAKGIRPEEWEEVLRELDSPKIIAERFKMIQSDSYSVS